MKELGKDKALIINTIASFVTFVVGLGIAFFFTPFLTDTVGEEAYGFVSLGNNVINYITILTVALNSVAGRFITIEYHQGKKKEANEYFSSVLMANIAIIPVILAVAVPAILNAEKLLDIPVELQASVKLLFFFILFNFIITLISTVYNVATFITNRLYLSSIANIVTKIIASVFNVSVIWYAASKCSLYWNRNLYLYVCRTGNEHVLYQIACT